jgi:hypothetical protein
LFSISLKVMLANGCSDSIQSNIHVFRQVSANFVLPFDSMCQFADLPLADASTYLNSSPGQSVWRLGRYYLKKQLFLVFFFIDLRYKGKTPRVQACVVYHEKPY